MKKNLNELGRLIELVEISIANGDAVDERTAVVAAAAKVAHSELSRDLLALESAMAGLMELTGEESMERSDAAWNAAERAMSENQYN